MGRKGCLLMILPLLLLSACAGGRVSEAETLTNRARTAYLELTACSGSASITADYGLRVYNYALDFSYEREGETVLTVTAPELLAGITARLAQGETVLEYDGAGLSLGLLDQSGLTPVSAVTGIMAQIEKGYMAKCAWAGENDGLLQITFQDPETEPGAGTQFLLTFDRAGYALLSAEVSVAGTTVLTAQTHDFTMELGHNETGDNADLG